MTINNFMHIYIGENAHWDIYAPPLTKSLHKFFFQFFFILDVYCCLVFLYSGVPGLMSPPLAHKIIFFEKKSTSSSKMGFSIEYSCHTIINIKHE